MKFDGPTILLKRAWVHCEKLAQSRGFYETRPETAAMPGHQQRGFAAQPFFLFPREDQSRIIGGTTARIRFFQKGLSCDAR
jgi:hypothetical protein